MSGRDEDIKGCRFDWEIAGLTPAMRPKSGNVCRLGLGVGRGYPIIVL